MSTFTSSPQTAPHHPRHVHPPHHPCPQGHPLPVLLSFYQHVDPIDISQKHVEKNEIVRHVKHSPSSSSSNMSMSSTCPENVSKKLKNIDTSVSPPTGA